MQQQLTSKILSTPDQNKLGLVPTPLVSPRVPQQGLQCSPGTCFVAMVVKTNGKSMVLKASKRQMVTSRPKIFKINISKKGN